MFGDSSIHRSDTSPATMHQTMIPCLKNSDAATLWRPTTGLMFGNDTFGKLEWFRVCFSDVQKHRCLAHIINLATQALISTRSKAKFYSPDSEDAHIPDLAAMERDEVGLVRAVCVKVWSMEVCEAPCLISWISTGTLILPAQTIVQEYPDS